MSVMRMCPLLAKRVLSLAALVFFFASQGRAQQTVEVSVVDYKFQPAELKIKVGDTVRWVNNEKRTSHSVLFPGNPAEESERFFPGESWSRRFEVKGTYPYICGPHPEMRATIVVE